MASKLRAMASNLLAMASNLITSDGLQAFCAISLNPSAGLVGRVDLPKHSAFHILREHFANLLHPATVGMARPSGVFFAQRGLDQPLAAKIKSLYTFLEVVQS